MATRFRLPSTGTPAVSPALQSYTHTGTTRRPLPLTDSSALTTTAVTPDAADHLVAGDTLHAQFVSEPLAAQTIASGLTWKLAFQCLEPNISCNMQPQIWIGLYDEAGTSLLATFRAKTVAGLEPLTTLRSVYLSGSTTAGYTCTGGERVVVEISVSGTPVAAGGVQGHNASLRFGSNGAGGDLLENETQTATTLNPWFELSADLTFAPTATAGTDTATVGVDDVSAVVEVDPWAGLRAYWKLDDTTATRLDQVGGRHLGSAGGVGYGTGVVGNTAYFDGSSSAYLASSSTGLDLSTTQDWSLAFWVYPMSDARDCALVNTSGATGSAKVNLFRFAGGELWNYSHFNMGGVLPINTWRHVVVTFTSGGTNTGTQRVYISGALSATDTGTVPAPNSGMFIVGSNLTASMNLIGSMDELAFWDRALTPTEVALVYNGGYGTTYTGPIPIAVSDSVSVAVAEDTTFEKAIALTDTASVGVSETVNIPPAFPTTGLVAYWKMDEASGTRMDSKGANHLTDVNTVGTAAAKLGTYAAQFIPANNEYFTIAHNADLAGGDVPITISCWCYIDSFGTLAHMYLANKTDSLATASHAYNLHYDKDSGGGRFNFSCSGPPSAYQQAVATNFGAVPTGTWLWVCAWHDPVNNLIGIQVNDTTPNTAGFSAGMSPAVTIPFRIGKNAIGNYPWNGRVDEVGFWQAVLSSTERAAVYNSGYGNTYTPEITAVAVSDSLSVGVTEAAVTPAVSLALTEAPTTSITDVRTIESSLALTEAPTVGVTDVRTILSTLALTESATVGITDAQTLASSLALTESATVQIGDVSAVAPTEALATIAVADSVSVAVADAAVPPIWNGLIAYWHLEESSGQRADSLGTRDLYDFGGTVVTSAAGKIGTAAQFAGGSGDGLLDVAGSGLEIGAADLSLTAWVYLTSLGAQHAIIAKSQNGGAVFGEYELYVDSGNVFRWVVYDTGGGSGSVGAGTASSGTWHFVAAWHDNTAHTINLQIDNGTVSSAAFSGTPKPHGQIFVVGKFGGAPEMAWVGRIDEVGAWRRVPTADERTALYNGGAGLAYPAAPSEVAVTPVSATDTASVAVAETQTIASLLALTEAPTVQVGDVSAVLPTEALQGVTVADTVGIQVGDVSAVVPTAAPTRPYYYTTWRRRVMA